MAQFTAGPGSPFPAGTTPVALAVADFNGDGRLDLAVADQNANGVTVLLANSSGGFTPAGGSPLATGTTPLSVVAADFNADGKVDLAVANSASGNVTILLGDGKGGFAPSTASPVSVGGNDPLSVAAGDFNGDGYADLAVTTSPSGVVVLMGDGKGGFTAATGSPFNGNFMVVGDFNGDGRADVATFSNGVGSMTVLLGQTGGVTVGPSSSFALGSGPYYSLAAADFNQDGKLDIAIANFGSNNLTVLLGGGTGSFTEAHGSPVAAGSQPYSLAAADFNGDGLVDLAVCYINGNTVNVLQGDGAGGFTSLSGGPFAAGSQPIAVGAGDFNGDGKADIAAANFGSNNVTLLLNSAPSLAVNPTELQFYGATGQASPPGIGVAVTPQTGPSATYKATSSQAWLSATPSSGSTGAPFTLTVSVNTASLGAGSYQGTIRLAAPGYFGATVSVTLSVASPSGAFTQASGVPSTPVVSVATGDFNNDGKPDLVVTNNIAGSSSTVSVLLGNGSGGFTQSYTSQFTASSGAVAAAVGDFNTDGKADFAVITDAASGTVTIWLGDGAGGFTQPSGGVYAAGSSPSSITAADFNGDGALDLAIGNSQGVTLLLGNGHGGFTAAPGSPVSVAGAGTASTIWAADFNGDGRQDVAILYGSLTVLLGDGNGGLQTAAGSPFASGAILASLADFNGDGKLDFAVVGSGGTVTAWLGNGSGGFAAGPVSTFSTYYTPPSMATADFNGDGKPDLAIFTPNQIPVNGLTVMLGDGTGHFTAEPAGIEAVVNSPAVTADFNGDGRADLAGATSVTGGGSIEVLLGALGATSTTLSTSTPNPVPAGQAVALSAKVAANGFASPGGTVSLLDGGSVLSTSNLNGGAAAFSTTLSPGTHNLTATYNGDAHTAASPPSNTVQVIVCSLTLSTSSVYLDSTSQASSISVTSNGSTCGWTASAGGFVTITSGGSGTGNGTVAFTVASNTTGVDRTATITVSGQVVLVVQRANAQVFADVPPPAYYFDFTNILWSEGITGGCSSNPLDFCPNDTVTREEMAVFIVTAIEGATFTYTTTPYFTDVPSSSLYFKFIQKLRDLGITSGCSATLFCPTDPVTREQMAAFIIRARYETTPYTYPTVPYFTDVPPSDIFFPFVQKMAQTGITSGCAPGLFCPTSTLPRGQMSVFVVTGLLNQLLPAGIPFLTTAAPNSGARGATLTVTLTGVNTHFAAGSTQIVLPAGITASNVTVASATSLTVQMTIDSGFVSGPVSIVALTGTEEAVLPNGFTVQ